MDGQSYTFDDNGNLLNTGTMTNTWDAANRLVETSRDNYILQPIYDGVGNRVAQTVGSTTTHFALDVGIGLPEVIMTNDGNSYLHLPGVIMAENGSGETRYLLSDGLGSIRQTVDETGAVAAYNEFDPYGNPVTQYITRPTPYGYTGEWWEDDLRLLSLRARWYSPQNGIFLSRDPVESEPPYQYVRGNVVNRVDPSGMFSTEAIKRSLGGKNIDEAFANRAGLFYLLRSAKEGDILQPQLVDFGSGTPYFDLVYYYITGDVRYNENYPLRPPYNASYPLSNPYAELSCNNGTITIGDFYFRKVTLDSYLVLLETFKNVDETFPWRPDTAKLHYYYLVKDGKKELWDDFGIGNSQIPDAIGIYDSFEIVYGINVTRAVDRYGNNYASGGLSGGYGVSIGIGLIEGYLGGPDGGSIPTEDELRGSLGGQNVSFTGAAQVSSIEAGFITDFPVPGFFTGDNEGVGWFTRGGFNLGASIGAAYAPEGHLIESRKTPELAWDWLDRDREGFSFNTIQSDLASDSVNECDCR